MCQFYQGVALIFGSGFVCTEMPSCLLQVLNSSSGQWKLHVFHAVGNQTTCRCLSSVTFWFCGWPLSVAASCFLAVVSFFTRLCESQNLFLLANQDVGEDCKAGAVFSSEDVSLTVLFLHFFMEFSTWWIMFLDDTTQDVRFCTVASPSGLSVWSGRMGMISSVLFFELGCAAPGKLP